MLLTFSGQDYALVLPALHIRYMPGFFPQHPAPVLFYSDFHFFAVYLFLIHFLPC